MSIPMSRQAPVAVYSQIAEDAWGPSLVARGRSDPRETPSPAGLACRDVVDEARARMARLGFQWD
ncbi:MAG: hypothetical protein LC745_13495 [Planctomycetia bacterium]|nr:hypothetical protein [Planctomycetia bacterium]